MQLGPGTTSLACARLIVPFAPFSEEEIFRWGELLGRFTAKKLYRWMDKQYDQEYWGRMEKNWRQWKGKKLVRRETMKTIPEEEEGEEEKLKEIKEDDDEMGNMVDPYYEL